MYVECECFVPRISDVIPSLVTKTLSSSSLPVNSSATTYRLGQTVLATSSMNWSNTAKKQTQTSADSARGHDLEKGGGLVRDKKEKKEEEEES